MRREEFGEALFEHMTAIDEELIERSEGKGAQVSPEKGLGKYFRKGVGRTKWACAAAGVVLMLGIGFFFFAGTGQGEGEGEGWSMASLKHLPGEEAAGSFPGQDGDGDGMAGSSLGERESLDKENQEKQTAEKVPDGQGEGGRETIGEQGENGMASQGNGAGQPGVPGQTGFDAPKAGTPVEPGSVDMGILLNKISSDVVQSQAALIATVPIGAYVALYERVEASSEDILKESTGDFVRGSENCYKVLGHTDLQYLIQKGEEGEYSLWEFGCFLQEDPYPFQKVLELIYDIDSPQDIARICSRPANMDNSDQGKALQEKIGERTIEDEEEIAEFYQVISSMTCQGQNRWDLIGLGGDQPDQTLEAVRKGRYLTLVTTWGNEIDKLKYTGVGGQFYQYGGIPYNKLAQEDAARVEEMLGIE